MHHTPVIKAHDVAGPELKGQLKPGVIGQGMEAPQRGVCLTHIGIRHIGESTHGIERTNRRHTLATQRIDLSTATSGLMRYHRINCPALAEGAEIKILAFKWEIVDAEPADDDED